MIIKIMLFRFLLLAGMGSATLRKYNISGTIYSTSENDVDKVMPNMIVHLMDEDHGFNSDDYLGDVVTDGHGHFDVVGEEDEEEEQEPYLRIPIDSCSGNLWQSDRITGVWLPSTPERQNVSIYLGYKNVAILHREGQEDLPLKIHQCH